MLISDATSNSKNDTQRCITIGSGKSLFSNLPIF